MQPGKILPHLTAAIWSDSPLYLIPTFSSGAFDELLFRLLQKGEWSHDLCSQFADYADYERRGIGVAALYQGTPVAGASSYTVYRGGIEIEIDTRVDFRRQGLATACGARLILNCLERGLYPSWDAHAAPPSPGGKAGL